MLADDLVAAVGRPVDVGCGGNTTRMAESIRGAQRFIVKPKVLDMVWEVLGLTLTQQYRALGVSQLPFEEPSWIEWSDNGTREGILIEPNGSSQRGTARAVTQFSDEPDPIVWPATVAFDWSEHPSPVAGDAICTVSDIDELDLSDPVTRRDMEGLRQFIARHDTTIESYPRTLTAQEDQAVRWSVYRSLQIARVTLLLLNSQGHTATTGHFPSAKLQKAREQRGKAPLLDFTQVDIGLSRILTQRTASTAEGDRGPVRLHMVRRHPRIIEKGLVWVRAHPRGSAAAGVISSQTRIISP
jgi:hypothetical protein